MSAIESPLTSRGATDSSLVIGDEWKAAATATLLSPFACVVWFGVVYEFVRLKMWRRAEPRAVLGLLVPLVIVGAWALWTAGAADLPVSRALLMTATGRTELGAPWRPDGFTGIVTLTTALLLGVIGLSTVVDERLLRKSYLVVTFAFIAVGLLGGSASTTLHALALAFPLATMLGVETFHRPMFERPLVAGCALASLCLYLM